MPFTISHAIVAPALGRRVLPPAAVAAGTMAPDLPLFVRAIDYDTTHSPLGALWTALPIALVFFAVWRALLQPALPRLLPRSFSTRLDDVAPPKLGLHYSGLVLLACSVGVGSHIAWDAFTHRTGAVVVALPALIESAGPAPAYAWLQYASSLGGLLGLGVLAVRWYQRRLPSASTLGAPMFLWVAALGVTAATGVMAAAVGMFLSVGVPAAVVGGVTAATSTAAVIVVGAAVVVRLRIRTRAGRRPNCSLREK